ncbi:MULTISPECIES: 50S ribosomal protein L21 [unclassified Roseivivax]|uniref:50S ribosomal protein L21 n=1 Tax=Roseivivax sp. GX 12232 TaxID=2900547 RepID=UPI001E3450B9|nr:50S ribosomal protein L21 [Roseivivax sp. GX 12232]MCE0506513.1 50S ribosomal protein L21 [Roseivivax sp. GX 12232]
MFAVMKTGGKQYKVQAGDTLRIEKLAADAGDKVQFNEILMLGGDDLTVGAPFVDGAAVQAEIVDQIKGDKVIHFVKRRRKHSSKRTKGHRQQLTMIRVTDILASGADKSGVKAAVGAGVLPRGEGESRYTANRAEQADMKARVKNDAAQEKSAPKAAVAEGAKDDLKEINGIGPAAEKKLNEAGILTFAQLATLDVDSFDAVKVKPEWVEEAKARS